MLKPSPFTLADLPFQAGMLPAAWANNASFPELSSLQLGLSELDSVSLSGSLPPEWGNQGAYQKLQSLTLGGSFTGTHSLATHSAHVHYAMMVVHRLQNMHASTLQSMSTLHCWHEGSGNYACRCAHMTGPRSFLTTACATSIDDNPPSCAAATHVMSTRQATINLNIVCAH